MMQSVGDTATGCQGAVTGLMFTLVPGGMHACIKLAPHTWSQLALDEHIRVDQQLAVSWFHYPSRRIRIRSC
jgi:hypothetical protein